ncbi:MAG: hypothetical protein JWM74_5455 [Myxococcaceae bacterium]|nr:hypothetical protein [Myxococcaceae bacterium]
MSLRPFALLSLFCGAFCGALLMPAVAQAQGTTSATVTIANEASLPRVDSKGNAVGKRPLLQPEGINLQDCHDDLFIQFPLTVTGFSTSDNFEVWATDQSGADCTAATARSGATQTCYRIDANFTRSQTQTVSLPVKAMIKGLPTSSTGALDAQGCRLVNSYTISVFFLVLRGTDIAGSAKHAFSVDTQGPSALPNVRALPGDGAVTISWDAAGEGGAEDILGAQAFCDLSPAPAGATDAGSTTTCTGPDGEATSVDAADPAAVAEAGATCTTTANPGGSTGGPIPTPSVIPSDGTACTTQSFTPASGTKLTPDQALTNKYGCGDVSGPTVSTIRVTSVNGQPLVNGQVVAVTVAATDSFGNIGEIAPPICQFPETTSDFWSD